MEDRERLAGGSLHTDGAWAPCLQIDVEICKNADSIRVPTTKFWVLRLLLVIRFCKTPAASLAPLGGRKFIVFISTGNLKSYICTEKTHETEIRDKDGKGFSVRLPLPQLVECTWGSARRSA